jgi:hypothetical protein
MGSLLIFGLHLRSARRVFVPQELAYPVLLVNDKSIAEVCLTPDELTLRPENTDHIIEQRFHVVDAQGHRYRIENFRSAEKRPSTLKRIFEANVFNVKRFRVAFELHRERALTREEVIAQLHDRAWLRTPDTTASSLAELYNAYRADRFREFGNARDHMPEETQNLSVHYIK